MSAYSVVQKSGHEISLEQSRGAAFALTREEADYRGEPVEVVWKGKDRYRSKWFRPKKSNPRGRMTKAQRAARAKRAGAKRRKANAITSFYRKMNPGKSVPDWVRVKRLSGGGFSVIPVKTNVRRRRRILPGPKRRSR